jgi:hypothetical protein
MESMSLFEKIKLVLLALAISAATIAAFVLLGYAAGLKF